MVKLPFAQAVPVSDLSANESEYVLTVEVGV
jgi:hypothetical protein